MSDVQHRRMKPGDDEWRAWCEGSESAPINEDFERNPGLESIVRRYSDGHAYEWRRKGADKP